MMGDRREATRTYKKRRAVAIALQFQHASRNKIRVQIKITVYIKIKLTSTHVLRKANCLAHDGIVPYLSVETLLTQYLGRQPASAAPSASLLRQLILRPPSQRREPNVRLAVVGHRHPQLLRRRRAAGELAAAVWTAALRRQTPVGGRRPQPAAQALRIRCYRAQAAPRAPTLLAAASLLNWHCSPVWALASQSGAAAAMRQ